MPRLAYFVFGLPFVISLSARATRTVFCSSFVRLLFVLCSSFVRSLFVLCSSFVRSLFVFCSFFVRLLFVFASLQFPLFESVGGGYLCLFTIRLSCYDCLCGSHRHLFVIPSSHFSVTTLPLLGRGLGRGYFVHLPVVLRLPVWLTPACATHTFNASFFTKLLPHTYQNISQRFFFRQS